LTIEITIMKVNASRVGTWVLLSAILVARCTCNWKQVKVTTWFFILAEMWQPHTFVCVNFTL